MKKLHNIKVLAILSASVFAPLTFATTLHDIKSFTAPTNAIQMAFSSQYNSLIIKNSGSAIKVVNIATDKVSSTSLANSLFTGISITPSGRYVYAADYGGENIGYGSPSGTSYVQRLDLLTNTWQTKTAYIAGGIAATADDQFVLKSNDQWVTFTNNSWSQNPTAATPLNTSSGYWGPGYYPSVYSGNIVYDQITGRLIHGNSGESSQELQAFKIINDNFIRQEGSGTYGTAQGFGGSLTLANDSSALYYGRLQVDPLDVSHNLHVFPETIYAATGDFAFGNGDYYDAHTGLLLGSFGFHSTVYGLDKSGNNFWAFDSDNNTLHYFSTTAPVPVPSAAWMFLSGFVGLIGLTRRKQ